MHTTTQTPTGGQLVDPDDLICPGCGEQVQDRVPEAGSGLDPEPGAVFSHRDFSELCRDAAGRLFEPAEVTR